MPNEQIKDVSPTKIPTMNRPSKQLSAVELRIGNWIMGNAPFQVDAMQISLAESRKREGFDIGWQPIPLTEEWLGRFGFVSNPYKDTYEKKYVVINCDKTKGYLDLWLDSLPVDLNYVHQLQNLYFALTGEELTIKTN